MEQVSYGADEAVQYDEAVEEPPDGQVVFLNDDYTTTDFVVSVLISVFHKGEGEAVRLMLETHEKGRAVIGVYALDIALTRSKRVIALARKEGYPLQVRVIPLHPDSN